MDTEGEKFTEERIDALAIGRTFDMLVAKHVMGRKVSFVKGPPCAWDGDGAPIMWLPNDWMLEDYDPKMDGISNHPHLYDPKRVFPYSGSDLGMTQVLDRLIENKGFVEISISTMAAAAGWLCALKYADTGAYGERQMTTASGRDPILMRMAVCRAALKAALL